MALLSDPRWQGVAVIVALSQVLLLLALERNRLSSLIKPRTARRSRRKYVFRWKHFLVSYAVSLGLLVAIAYAARGRFDSELSMIGGAPVVSAVLTFGLLILLPGFIACQVGRGHYVPTFLISFLATLMVVTVLQIVTGSPRTATAVVGGSVTEFRRLLPIVAFFGGTPLLIYLVLQRR